LQRLSADRLVVTEGNRGFAVAPFDAEEFTDLNTARIAVEKAGLAAVAYAMAGSSGKAASSPPPM
jgi:DNA-binding GntR family transcriptional regulator